VNRRVFEERLNQILNSRRVSEDSHIFCYLDLDQFKIINDTCGHTAGDELLKQVTSILRTKVRVRDTLARLGGDEFGILIEHCPLERAECLANSCAKPLPIIDLTGMTKVFGLGSVSG
jgi:diguanylate cyclase (GGDEF)-like protein